MPGGHEPDNSANWVVQTRTRLAQRRAEKPATKAGQIRALWPDVEAALAVGQSMKTICGWLAQDAGITLGVTSLTSYVSRIRRREEANRRSEGSIGQPVRSEFGSIPASRETRPSFVPDTAVAERLTILWLRPCVFYCDRRWTFARSTTMAIQRAEI